MTTPRLPDCYEWIGLQQSIGTHNLNAALANRANLNALVIDDDTLIQKLIKSTLGILGVRKIKVVSDGRAALQAVQLKEQEGDPFDIILCDWDMPVMDGIGFLEAFRKNNQNAVVIMVTARTSHADFDKAKTKGADFFFMKPLDMSMLKIRLAAALDVAFERT